MFVLNLYDCRCSSNVPLLRISVPIANSLVEKVHSVEILLEDVFLQEYMRCSKLFDAGTSTIDLSSGHQAPGLVLEGEALLGGLETGDLGRQFLQPNSSARMDITVIQHPRYCV